MLKSIIETNVKKLAKFLLAIIIIIIITIITFILRKQAIIANIYLLPRKPVPSRQRPHCLQTNNNYIR